MALTFVAGSTVVVMVTSVAMAARDVVNQPLNVAVIHCVALTTQTVVQIRNTVVPLGSRAVTKQSVVALATIIAVVSIAVRLVLIAVQMEQVVTRTGTSAVVMACPVPWELSVAGRSVVDRASNAVEHNVVKKIQSAVKTVVVKRKLIRTLLFT